MHIWKTDCSSKQGSAYRPERRVRHEPEGGGHGDRLEGAELLRAVPDIGELRRSAVLVTGKPISLVQSKQIKARLRSQPSLKGGCIRINSANIDRASRTA